PDERVAVEDGLDLLEEGLGVVGRREDRVAGPVQAGVDVEQKAVERGDAFERQLDLGKRAGFPLVEELFTDGLVLHQGSPWGSSGWGPVQAGPARPRAGARGQGSRQRMPTLSGFLSTASWLTTVGRGESGRRSSRAKNSHRAAADVTRTPPTRAVSSTTPRSPRRAQRQS